MSTLWPSAAARADCRITSSSGSDDVVVCSNPPDTNGIFTGYGNDTVTVNADTSVVTAGDAIGTSYGSDVVTNRGLIRSGDDSVDLGRGSDRVNNYGRIDTSVDAAVMCFPQSGQTCRVVNYASGVIAAPLETIDVVGNGGNLIVTNEGSIISSIEEGIHSHNVETTTLINRGTIQGGSAGIEVYPGVGKITNYGTIVATNEGAVDTYHRSDTIVNYGTIRSMGMSAIVSEGGSDVIKNFGTIYTEVNYASQGSISADDGNDQITNRGSLTEAGASRIAIEGGFGSDTVIVEGGAINGLILGDDVSGRRSGDWDILAFQFTSSSQSEMNAFVTAVRGQSASGGSVVWRGLTYRWRGFEQIKVFFNGTRVVDTGSIVADGSLLAPFAWVGNGPWLRSANF